jgi:hypothetical protein
MTMSVFPLKKTMPVGKTHRGDYIVHDGFVVDDLLLCRICELNSSRLSFSLSCR